MAGGKGRVNWLDTHLESKEEAAFVRVVKDVTSTVIMMNHQGREGVQQAGNWKEEIEIEIEPEMLRKRGTRDYLTPGGMRREVLTIDQGVSIIMATEVTVQEPGEELTTDQGVSIIMATEVTVQEPEEELTIYQGVSIIMATEVTVQEP
jgi:hypothetical protein